MWKKKKKQTKNKLTVDTTQRKHISTDFTLAYTCTSLGSLWTLVGVCRCHLWDSAQTFSWCLVLNMLCSGRVGHNIHWFTFWTYTVVDWYWGWLSLVLSCRCSYYYKNVCVLCKHFSRYLGSHRCCSCFQKWLLQFKSSQKIQFIFICFPIYQQGFKGKGQGTHRHR